MSSGSKESSLDWKFLLILILGISGFVTYTILDKVAFPSNILNFSCTKAEITARAKNLAAVYGYNTDNSIESTVFLKDGTGINYIEHVYSLQEAKRILSTEVPVWYWRTRFCREFEKESFFAWYSPDGQLLSFNKIVPSDLKIEDISHEDAKKMAYQFMLSTFQKGNEYTKLISDTTTPLLNRKEHSFIWENPVKKFKDARLRIYVLVSGNQILECSKTLHIPEKWGREYSKSRILHDVLSKLSDIFTLSLYMISYVLAAWGVVTKNIRWRVAIYGGLFLTAVSFLNVLNALPVTVSYYSTSSDFLTYLFNRIGSELASSVYRCVNNAVLIAGAEIAYRLMFSQFVSLNNIINPQGIFSRQTLRAIGIGHLTAGISLGWLTLYYLVGKNIGLWMPLDVDYEQVFSDIVPAYNTFANSILAAIPEELSGRIIGLWIGIKLFKQFWIANLFQALIWGFSHSNYMQEPAWARGVELTFVGLVQGWILRRYGIVACVVSHYLYNVIVCLQPILYSGSMQYNLSSIPPLGLFALIPFLAVTIAKKHINSGAASKNSDDKINLQTKETSHPKEPFAYKQLSNKFRMALLLIVFLGIVSCFSKSDYSVNSDTRLYIDKKESIRLAKQIAQEHNKDLDSWMTYASCSPGSGNLQYLHENTSDERLKELYEKTRRGFRWRVRFFRPLQTDEYIVYVDNRGKELSFVAAIDEDSAGPALESEDAKRMADNYLSSKFPEYINRKFDSVSRVKRKNRVDYIVNYSVPEYKVGDAIYKITVSVKGDQISNFYGWWDIPDSWSFERSKKNLRCEIGDKLNELLRVLVYAGFFFWCCYILRSGTVKLDRTVTILTLVWITAIAFDDILDLTYFYDSYNPVNPVAFHVFNEIVASYKHILKSGISTLLFIAICLGAYRKTFKGDTLQSFYSTIKTEFSTRNNLLIDGVLTGYATISIIELLSRISDLSYKYFSPQVMLDSYGHLCHQANAFSPVISEIFDAVYNLLSDSGYFFAIVAILLALKTTYRKLLAIGIIYFTIKYCGYYYWQDGLIEIIYSLAYYSIIYFIVTRIARNNFIAYITYFLASDIFWGSLYILKNDCLILRNDYMILVTILTLPLLSTLVLWWRQNRCTDHLL